MPSLPPVVKGYLFYDGVWNDISNKMRQTEPIKITRGADSEQGANSPTKGELVLDNRDGTFSPRNPNSPLFDRIGRNTPMKIAVETGPPYLFIPSESLFFDSAIVAQDAAQMDFTGDADFRIELSCAGFQNFDFGIALGFASRWEFDGNNRCWWWGRSQSGEMYFAWTEDGLLHSTGGSVESTAKIPFFNTERVALRVTLDVDNGAGGWTIRFWYSNQIDGEWVELGDPVVDTTSGSTFIFNGNGDADIWVGAGAESIPQTGGFAEMVDGKVYAFQMRQGINGPLMVDFDAARDAEVGDTSFVDGSGLTWVTQEDAEFRNEYVRLVGEIPSWPPNRDLSGNNKDVSIEPTGITRRLDAGNKPLESALFRYIRALPGQPIDCWPLTDGVQADGGANLVPGGSPMIVRIEDITVGEYLVNNERYEWASGTIAKWIEPVGIPAEATNGFITGECREDATAASSWAVDWFFSGINTDNTSFQCIDRTTPTTTDGTIVWNIEPNPGSDSLQILRAVVTEDSSSLALLENIVAPGIFDKKPHHIRLAVQPSGGTTFYDIYIDGQLRETGSMALSSTALRRTRVNWFFDSADESGYPFGFVTYWGSNAPPAEDIYNAFSGFPGETSGERFNRLCIEQGVGPNINHFGPGGAGGELQFQQRMGTQGLKKIVNLFQDCADSDVGIFMETREDLSVALRARSMLYNQAPRFTLDFSNGVISAPFKPVDDDKLTENDVIVQRVDGAFSQQVLTEGRMSVQDPPDGVGRYDVSKALSLYRDDQTDSLAYWFLHMGTFDGLRYTKITVDLANPRVYEMVHKILGADLGDKIRITNLPNEYGPDDVDLIIRGYDEEIGPSAWRITFNCSPGETWTTASAALDIYENFEDTALNIHFTNAGSANWGLSTAQAHTGSSSWKSGTIANNQVSDFVVTIPPGAEKIEFWYKTDSEASGPGFDGDQLIVLRDGVEQFRSGGPNSAWQLGGFDVSSASTVTFRYDKDNSTAVGADAAWIDDLRFRMESPANVHADTEGAYITEGLTTGETGIDTYSTGVRFITSEESVTDFPFDLRLGGEVVRVNSSGPALYDEFEDAPAATVTDTFTRTVANAWGSADTGQAWTMTGGAASDYSTNGTRGLMSAGSVNVSRFGTLGSVSIADCVMQADFVIPAVATGASISTGLRLRVVDGSNYYYVEAIQATSGNISIQLVSRVASVSTTIAGPVSKGAYAAAQTWRIKAVIVGDVLKAKLWQTTGSEPDLWDVYAVTTTLPAANPPGLRHILSTGNTNTLPVVATFDNITVTPVTQGWGTSTSGDTWTTEGGSASNFYVMDGDGVIELTTVNSSRRVLTGPSWVDVDQKMLVQVPIVALTDSIDPGLLARYDTNSNYYLGTLHFHNDATVDVRIRKVVGGTFTTLAISDLLQPNYAPGSKVWVRFRVQGDQLKAKMWFDGVAEPNRWDIEVTDTSHDEGGDVGIRANLQINNTNLLPVTIRVEDYEVISPQQLVVTRSINGVVKTHSSGTKVELANPPIVAL